MVSETTDVRVWLDRAMRSRIHYHVSEYVWIGSTAGASAGRTTRYGRIQGRPDQPWRHKHTTYGPGGHDPRSSKKHKATRRSISTSRISMESANHPLQLNITTVSRQALLIQRGVFRPPAQPFERGMTHDFAEVDPRCTHVRMFVNDEFTRSNDRLGKLRFVCEVLSEWAACASQFFFGFLNRRLRLSEARLLASGRRQRCLKNAVLGNDCVLSEMSPSVQVCEGDLDGRGAGCWARRRRSRSCVPPDRKHLFATRVQL